MGDIQHGSKGSEGNFTKAYTTSGASNRKERLQKGQTSPNLATIVEPMVRRKQINDVNATLNRKKGLRTSQRQANPRLSHASPRLSQASPRLSTVAKPRLFKSVT